MAQVIFFFTRNNPESFRDAIVDLFRDYCNAVEKEKNKPDGVLYLIIVPINHFILSGFIAINDSQLFVFFALVFGRVSTFKAAVRPW